MCLQKVLLFLTYTVLPVSIQADRKSFIKNIIYFGCFSLCWSDIFPNHCQRPLGTQSFWEQVSTMTPVGLPKQKFPWEGLGILRWEEAKPNVMTSIIQIHKVSLQIIKKSLHCLIKAQSDKPVKYPKEWHKTLEHVQKKESSYTLFLLPK